MRDIADRADALALDADVGVSRAVRRQERPTADR